MDKQLGNHGGKPHNLKKEKNCCEEFFFEQENRNWYRKNGILTAIDFIRAVGAVGPVVALAARLQASLAVGAAKLVQVTGCYVGGETAAVFIRAVSAVDETVAFLLGC